MIACDEIRLPRTCAALLQWVYRDGAPVTGRPAAIALSSEEWDREQPSVGHALLALVAAYHADDDLGPLLDFGPAARLLGAEVRRAVEIATDQEEP